MRIVVEQGSALYFDQVFKNGTIYIGHHDQCQIKLSGEEQIAPRHLMVFEEKGQWYIEPLHDKFKTTYLNGAQLKEKTLIADGSECLVGNFKIRFQTGEKGKSKSLPYQVIAKGYNELRDTLGFQPAEMNLPETVIIKNRNDTFSLSKGRMDYISELTLKLMDQADVRELLSVLGDALLKDFDAACVWVGLRTDAEGHLHLSAGKDIAGRAIDAPATAKRFSFATVECVRAILQQVLDTDPERSCMACPLAGPDGSMGMLYLESIKGKPRYTVADLDTLVFIASRVAMVIDHLLRLQTDQIEKIRSLDQEMARKVQARTAPWQLPQWPELKLAVLTEGGSSACTDFYDVLPLGEKMGMILVGQTSAEQSDAAVSIAEFSAAFRIGAVHRDIPPVLMRQINWLLFSSSGEPRKLSAGILGIDPQSGEFCISLAGSVSAFLIGTSGKVVQLKTDNNPLVGESRKSKYEAIKGRLNVNQFLAICTNGLFSVTSPDGEKYTQEHLLDFLQDNADQIPTRIMSELVDDLSAFTGGQKPVNDVTLLLIRRGEPGT
jgi:serine phosphatase RsbU (regulator of sigma subunit)